MTGTNDASARAHDRDNRDNRSGRDGDRHSQKDREQREMEDREKSDAASPYNRFAHLSIIGDLLRSAKLL